MGQLNIKFRNLFYQFLLFLLAFSIGLPNPYYFSTQTKVYAANNEETDIGSDTSDDDSLPTDAIKNELTKPEIFRELVGGLDEHLRGQRTGVHPLDKWGALSQRMVYLKSGRRILPIDLRNIDVVLGDYHRIGERLSEEQLKKYLSWIFDDADENFINSEGELVEVQQNADGSVIPPKANSQDSENEALRYKHYFELKNLSLGELTHLVYEVAERMGIRLDESALFLTKLYSTVSDEPARLNPFAKILNERLIYSDADPNSHQVVRYSDFAASTQNNFSTNNLMFEAPISYNVRKPTFSFANRSSQEVFEEFSVPVRTVFFYGKYLIFVEDGSGYNQDSKTQYISFIDLERYQSSVGLVGLPIFKVALPSDQEIQDIRIEEGRIKVGLLNPGKTEFSDQWLDTKELSRWSDLNFLAYNAYVNLLDPQRFHVGAAQVESFAFYLTQAQTFFYSDLKEQGQNVELLGHAFVKHGQEILKGLEAHRKMKVASNGKGALKPLDFSDIKTQLTGSDQASFMQLEALDQTLRENGNVQQKVMRSYANMWGFVTRLNNRTKLILSQMQTPRWDGIEVIQNVLISISARFNKDTKADLEAGRYKTFAQTYRHPYAKWGFRAVATAGLAALFPETVGAFLYDMAATGASLVDSIFGFAGNLGYVLYDSGRQGLKYLNPAFLVPFLWEHGAPLIYVTGHVMFNFVAIPWAITQFITSSFKLGADLYAMNPLEDNSGNRFLRIYRYMKRVAKNLSLKNFILQQRRLRVTNFKEMAKAAEELQQRRDELDEKDREATKDITPKQRELAREIMASIEEEIEASLDAKWWIKYPRKFFSGIKKTLGIAVDAAIWPYKFLKEKHLEKVGEANQLQKQKTEAKGKINNLGSALRHFMLSWPSFTVMQRTTTKFLWNSWFLFRSFSWHPILFTRSLLQPNLAFRVVDPQGKTILPTEFNGANRNLLHQLYLWFARTDYSEVLAKWENAIIPIEQEIHVASLRAATQAMTQFATSQDEFLQVYDGNTLNNWSVGQIKHLNNKSQFFFRYYAELVQQEATHLFLRDHFDNKVRPLMTMDEMSEHQRNELQKRLEKVGIDWQSFESNGELNLKEIKKLSLATPEELSITAEEASKYVQQAMSDDSLYKKAEELANTNALISAEKFSEKYFQQGVIKQMNPKANRQIERVLTVNEMLSDAGHTARGVRYVASNWKISIPISMVLSFLGAAGLEGGAYQLVQEGDDGESYMGFSSAMLVGTAFALSLSIVGGGDLFLKVQRDELHKNKFDERLSDEEKDLGIIPLWYRKSFRNPDNRFKDNYAHYINKIVVPNIKAALWNFITSNAIYWQRFDLGIFLMSYLMMSMIPSHVLDQQMDQGFELAVSSYLTSKFPPEVVALPEVQEFINKIASRYRDIYTVINKGYEEVSGAIDSAYIISTEDQGLRALERTFFGGWSIAELSYYGLEQLQGVVRPIPGAEALVDACEKFLTNNMSPEMFQNIQAPPWIAK